MNINLAAWNQDSVFHMEVTGENRDRRIVNETMTGDEFMHLTGAVVTTLREMGFEEAAGRIDVHVKAQLDGFRKRLEEELSKGIDNIATRQRALQQSAGRSS